MHVQQVQRLLCAEKNEFLTQNTAVVGSSLYTCITVFGNEKPPVWGSKRAVIGNLPLSPGGAGQPSHAPTFHEEVQDLLLRSEHNSTPALTFQPGGSLGPTNL